MRSNRQCHSPGDPEKELVSIIDNIGIPYSGLNLSYTSTGVVGAVGCRHHVLSLKSTIPPISTSRTFGPS